MSAGKRVPTAESGEGEESIMNMGRTQAPNPNGGDRGHNQFVQTKRATTKTRNLLLEPITPQEKSDVPVTTSQEHGFYQDVMEADLFPRVGGEIGVVWVMSTVFEPSLYQCPCLYLSVTQDAHALRSIPFE
ncbi:hypothetical protein KIPB_008438 [Kipferlia bialata]|uniref:Uncharacterized protein n=1 Tax=Kipferlia bialata TaxID=797122 RepID=A0A391NN89_9EUKA|nr:hypothetical protein KIPB_005318 [Kipferlia bialata]GCA63194.1 hypothetical protein KIPB_008438 [Kipferlia bialata]|eukprot:g5318.t1